MIADDRNKVLIGTPTKTGTHSVEAMTRRAEKDPSSQLRLVRMPGSKIPRHHHMLVPDDCSDYRRVLMVRHPMDRLASLYFWLLKWPWQWKSRADEFTELSLDEFCSWWLNVRDEIGLDGGYIKPMMQFNWWRSPNIWCVTLSECSDAFVPHDFIRLESLEVDLNRLVPRDWGAIPHVNRSRAIGDGWRTKYKPKTIRFMAAEFDDDLENFGYDI
jgi:hypothetical protein